MIGQAKLIEQFNKFTIDTLPHSIILVGKYGCGKHLFCSLLVQKFGLELNQIDDKINYDLLESINNKVIPTLCVINSNKITTKEEAVLLKFIEEPKVNVFIVILAESTTGILETIINRCQVFRFEEYTKDELMQFTQNELVLKLADTPGKILNWNLTNLNDLLILCNKIFDTVKKTRFSSILTISDSITFDPEKPAKYDLNIFVAALLYTISERFKDNKENSLQYYLLTNQLLNNLSIANVNKKYLFEHYLCELKGVK